MKRIKEFLSKRRHYLIIISIVFFLLGSATYFIFSKKSTPVTTPIANVPAPSIIPFEIPEELKDLDAFNVLLLGYGGAGHDGGFLTDVIILAHFNFKEKVLGLISIPRDLWVRLPDGRESKINAAFVAENAPQYPTESVSLEEALAGATQTKSVIQSVTGMDPNFFVGIDFNSFAVLIDQLGGVSVDVPEAFEDEWYPVKGRELELCGLSPEEMVSVHQKYSGFQLEQQFPCRYETLSFSKGTTQMNGETALKFVRSRHSSTGGGDFARSARQQAVLLGIRDKLLSPSILKDPVGIFTQFNKSVQTNLNENLVANLVPLLANAGDYRVVNIGLNDANVLGNATAISGAFILTPRSGEWASVQDFIRTQLQQE